MRWLTAKNQQLLFLCVVVNSISSGFPEVSSLGRNSSSSIEDFRSISIEVFYSLDQLVKENNSFPEVDFLDNSNEVIVYLDRRKDDLTNLNSFKSGNSKFFFELKSFMKQQTI